MVNVLRHSRCAWEVFDPVTAVKQLHVIPTKHIPVAKGSPVTPSTGCCFATGDRDCTEAVEQLGLGWLQVLAFPSPFLGCQAILREAIQGELGFCHREEEDCAPPVPGGH